MRIDNKLRLPSSAEQAMHKYLFEDIYDFLGTVTRKRLMAYLEAADANARATQIMISWRENNGFHFID